MHLTFAIAVPLAVDRQAKRQACVNQRASAANLPPQHIRGSDDFSSTSEPSVHPGRQIGNAAAVHLAVERDVQVSQQYQLSSFCVVT